MNIFKNFKIPILAAAVCMAGITLAAAGTLKSFDGYGLDYTIEYPEAGSASGVVVLIHGSGGHDMDEDLSGVSAPGVKNLFFVDVSSALRKVGFAVIRYNKRSFQLGKTLKSNPGYLKSNMFEKFSASPLKYFAGDVEAFVDLAAKKFPKSPLYLLGHSEGSVIALRVADTDPRIKGVALIGFMAQSLDVAMFEQTVYRPLSIFETMDRNKDAFLDAVELSGDKAEAKVLAAQLPVLDLDKDGRLSKSEFMAGNYSHLLSDISASMPAYRREEAGYKRPAAIIKDAKFNIAFFQGELDNQTPAYVVKSVQIMNSAVWKKANIHFRYYAGLGHALDPRDNYQDILFRPADKKALEAMAADLAGLWK